MQENDKLKQNYAI